MFQHVIIMLFYIMLAVFLVNTIQDGSWETHGKWQQKQEQHTFCFSLHGITEVLVFTIYSMLQLFDST
jgi:hypothetical protein